jgi:hypothetical protein
VLLRALESFVSQYIDLPRFELSLIAHYAMATWVWDAWNAVPYLRFKGEPGTGKTRCLEALEQICYRSVNSGPNPTKSVFFRRAEVFRGTMILDEADIEGDLRSDYIQMLNVGYKKNGTVSVSDKNGDRWEPKSFRIGGPKVLSNRLDFPDRALETRCFTIYTVSKSLSEHIPIELSEEFYADGVRLRNMLLKYRMDTFHAIQRDETPMRGLDGRTAQIGLPIHTISPDPDFRRAFLNFLRNRTNDRREVDPLKITLEAIQGVRLSGRSDRISLPEVGRAAQRFARDRDVAAS